MRQKIDWVDYGIGAKLGSTIVLNRDLKRYPEFMKKVIAHERKHTNNKWTVEDLRADTEDVSLWDNFKFCLKHPKGFYTFLPFWRYKGEWYYDITEIIIYVAALVILGLFWYVG